MAPRSRPGSLDPIVIAPMDNSAPATARRIHAVQMRAYRQEAALLGVGFFAPLEHTAQDVQASRECYFGAWIGRALAGVVSIVRFGR